MSENLALFILATGQTYLMKLPFNYRVISMVVLEVMAMCNTAQ